jgi:hypothetical protein
MSQPNKVEKVTRSLVERYRSLGFSPVETQSLIFAYLAGIWKKGTPRPSGVDVAPLENELMNATDRTMAYCANALLEVVGVVSEVYADELKRETTDESGTKAG